MSKMFGCDFCLNADGSNCVLISEGNLLVKVEITKAIVFFFFFFFFKSGHNYHLVLN